jgi:hypothetical protein
MTKDYKHLSYKEAFGKIETIKSTLKKAIADNGNILSKAELTYFQRNFQLQHRLPIFYDLPKVHKIPIKFQSPLDL